MSESVCTKNNVIVIGDSNIELDSMEEHYFPEGRVFFRRGKGFKNSGLLC